MKKFLLCFIFLLGIFNAFGQKTIDKPYDFPIKPGSSEWANFSTGKEMVDACQIPAPILSKLTTKALALTCLNYPLYFQHTAFNDERKAIEGLIKEFNGLQELVKRPEGYKELVNIYTNLPIVKKDSRQLHDEDVPYKTIYIELLLASESFINKAPKKQLDELQVILLNKYDSKLRNNEIYSLYNIRKSLLLGAVVKTKLDSANSKNSLNSDKIKYFIKNHEKASEIELTEISRIITEQ